MKLINYNNKFLPDIVFDNFIYSQLEKINSITHFDPAINVKEEDKCFEIEFAVPGKQKNEFLIEINNDILSVSLNDSKNKENKLQVYSLKEFSYESFLRTFNLSDNIDQKKISANYENGVLKIKLPKITIKKNIPRQIKIS
ncbi:MAG: Hsp20/alpha crystallin family protein [Flavobacteriaceae bacterium]|nr:Hsp20/alpha crystallin family protein [Flavobacteriaceae bacterium]